MIGQRPAGIESRLVKCLERFPEDMRKSITYDNGTENALHELTNQFLRTLSQLGKG
jgi:IS30 family transposase